MGKEKIGLWIQLVVAIVFLLMGLIDLIFLKISKWYFDIAWIILGAVNFIQFMKGKKKLSAPK